MTKNSVQIIKTILIIAIIAAGIFYLRTFDINSHLDKMINWIEDFGFWAPFIFIVFYMLTAGYVLPVILVTIIAGVLFGVIGGSAVVSFAFTLSSVIVYLVGRFYGKNLIPRRIQSSKKFTSVTNGLKEDGFKLVFMLRFVPVVSSIILNLTCGMVKIKPKDFILGTFLGQLPGTILYTYSGFLAKGLMQARENINERSTAGWIMLSAGIIATLGVVILITIKSKKALKNIE